MRKLADMPKLDRPREKLQLKGVRTLSDLELLAVMLGSGTREHDVMTVADRVLKVLDFGIGFHQVIYRNIKKLSNPVKGIAFLYPVVITARAWLRPHRNT